MRILGPLTMVLMLLMVGVPQAAAEDDDESQQSSVRVSYDLGFRLETADNRFLLNILGLLQLRYSYVDYDHRIRDNEVDYSNFYMRRARLYFAGHAFNPRFKYFFHIQLEPTRSINAHDLWLEYTFSDLVRLGAGRNKIAYGLEFLNSGGGLGMVERSVFSGETDIDLGPLDAPGPRYPGGGTTRFGLAWEASNGFATGGLNLYRSQGIQLQGRRGTNSTPTFEYQLGLWQGRNTLGLSNDSTGHLYSARVGYYPWGFIDWRFVGDAESSPQFKLGLLASVYVNSDRRGGGYSEHGHNLAAMAQYRGVSADLEWGTEVFDYDLLADDFERSGWRLEVGWFVLPAKVELRARYAEIERLEDPTYWTAIESGLGVAEIAVGDGWSTAIESGISETSIGVNYFINEWHRHKLQFDVSRLVRSFIADRDAVIDGTPAPIAKAPDQVDYRARAMVQLVF